MSPRRPLCLAAVLGLAVTLLAAPARAAEDPPFRDPSLPLNQRVDDLLGRLTVAEKISFLHQFQPAVPRLGIGLFKTGTEALHGVAWSTDIDNGGAVVTADGTVFPQAVGLASTWDPALIKQVGTVVGTEARGFNARNPKVWGLNMWAPVVNLLRDPRWGRNEEGYSEDPTLTGAMSIAYASGMRGDDPDHLRTAPTLKHYLANNNEAHRDTTNSSLRPRVEQEYDQAAFKPAIATDAATGVMASYNLVNGRPATVNPALNDVVRTWTRRDLMNVTDAHAPNNLVNSQAYYPNLAEGDAAALKAGIDSYTTDDTNAAPTVNAVTTALSQGLVTQADIDRAVRHLLSIRFRLGEFDPGGGPYGSITPDVIDTPAHRALNRRTAGAATVLLKNSGRTLPLSPSTRKVAVIGPLSDTLYTDWYSGNLPYKVTPLAGIRERLGTSATVTGTEGADRIALKNAATGRYITAGAGASGSVLTESATTTGPTTQFDAFDWGDGVLTLRSAANGKYVGYNWSSFVNDQAQPNGWFVQQQFKLEPQPDGTNLLRYAGYETAFDWFGPNKYLAPNSDGVLALTTADKAAKFTRELVTDGTAEAVAAAKAADAAVLVVGSMPFINGREDHDRTDMNLAAAQEALVKAVTKANPKTVVVLENSYPTTVTWLQDNVPAILWTTHAGAETGHAVADVLFGDVNPAARLTQTWPRKASDLPDILNYDIIKAGATYLYSKAKPLYPFGHGLSYTTFAYSGLKLNASSVRPDGTVTATVKVQNTGRAAGDEVVQLYTHQHTSRTKQPVKQLRAFQRVHLTPGQTKTVTLTFKASDLALWDVTRDRWSVEKSTHDIMVGSSSTAVHQRTTLQVAGETIPPRDLTTPTKATTFDDHNTAELVDLTKTTGTAVATQQGTWLAYNSTSLNTPTKFTATTSTQTPVRVELRQGSPTGKLLATLTPATTADKYTYTTTTTPVTRLTGTHDLYLVFTGPARIKDFSLTR
ncbi:glycoside hydrolase family 3 protein [Sphaerisporangium rubeum]|uniref:Exo-alpha-(1->6)-L-arabinopyranosidase n=1 Tax=Sphaerisporangium rubeum TaxID=321317 RepID=A0A7X0M6Z9_9ACTN|nr:glycoside hydrolase family 3 protein [Sphaerisporangium rubeum]MBB6472504.1 beta-glucosidase [Sphaerisporangium rubeum]